MDKNKLVGLFMGSIICLGLGLAGLFISHHLEQSWPPHIPENEVWAIVSPYILEIASWIFVAIGISGLLLAGFFGLMYVSKKLKSWLIGHEMRRCPSCGSRNTKNIGGIGGRLWSCWNPYCRWVWRQRKVKR